MKIRLKIKEVAQSKGFNQSRLQMEARVTLPLLGRYWNNKTASVELASLARIAEALEVQPGELLEDEETIEPMWP